MIMSAVAWRMWLSFVLIVICLADHTEAFTTLPRTSSTPEDTTTVNKTTVIPTSYFMTKTSGTTSTNNVTSTSTETSTSITSTSTDNVTSTTDYTTDENTRPSCKNGTPKPCKSIGNRCRKCGWVVLTFVAVLLILYAACYYRHKIRIWIQRCIRVMIRRGDMSSVLLQEQYDDVAI
ncbi:uncharacterized protein [Amphiura filiformis]|uniref:uncharacterized protein n=1 Tax=Amphiura filiformis TaxID=82378 RepID=UPI003B20BFC8